MELLCLRAPAPRQIHSTISTPIWDRFRRWCRSRSTRPTAMFSWAACRITGPRLCWAAVLRFGRPSTEETADSMKSIRTILTEFGTRRTLECPSSSATRRISSLPQTVQESPMPNPAIPEHSELHLTRLLAQTSDLRTSRTIAPSSTCRTFSIRRIPRTSSLEHAVCGAGQE